eukprot:ANDGO_01552.mRNA.1 heat shock protein
MQARETCMFDCATAPKVMDQESMMLQMPMMMMNPSMMMMNACSPDMQMMQDMKQMSPASLSNGSQAMMMNNNNGMASSTNMMMMRSMNKMSCDIMEMPECYMVMIDCPGCAKEDICVELCGDIMRICCNPKSCAQMCAQSMMMAASTTPNAAMNNMMCHRMERCGGMMCQRLVRLPMDCIMRNKITAECKNGLCCITCPKTTEAMKNQICMSKVDCK